MSITFVLMPLIRPNFDCQTFDYFINGSEDLTMRLLTFLCTKTYFLISYEKVVGFSFPHFFMFVSHLFLT